MSGTWFKVSNNFPDHVDVIGLSDSAFRSFIQSLAYSSRNETDGWIPVAAARRVMSKKRDAAELVEAGRLVERSGGWLIVNYLDHQRSKAQIEAEREAARKRKARQRHAETPDNVTLMSRRDAGGGHA